MKNKNDGGPAFPVWELNGQGKPEMTGFGLTLRDWFAAKAMQAYLTTERGQMLHENDIADCAYHMADAMIEQREA